MLNFFWGYILIHFILQAHLASGILPGDWGATKSSRRQGIAQMDELPFEESRFYKSGLQFFIWYKGVCEMRNRLWSSSACLVSFGTRLYALFWYCHRYFLTAYTSLQDGEAYTFLLNILAPQTCSLSPLEVKDPLERAKAVLNQAEQIGCRRYVTPKDIVEGSTNLNLAFVANLFHERCLYYFVIIGAFYLTDFTKKWYSSISRNGLTATVDNVNVSFAEMIHDDEQTSREERAFRMWINSLGVSTYINNLFEDLRDGWVMAFWTTLYFCSFYSTFSDSIQEIFLRNAGKWKITSTIVIWIINCFMFGWLGICISRGDECSIKYTESIYKLCDRLYLLVLG